MALVTSNEFLAPVCAKIGCGKTVSNGQHAGFCSSNCKNEWFKTPKYVCAGIGCWRGAWNDQSGELCSRCRDKVMTSSNANINSPKCA